MNEIEFQLMSISLLDELLPQDIEKIKVDVSEVRWQYSFSFTVNPFPGNKKCIRPEMSYKLYYRNDSEKKPIAFVKASNLFSVSGPLDADEKHYILHVLLAITSSCIAGIYAAKTEGSALAKILPPMVDFSKFDDLISEKIADEWE